LFIPLIFALALHTIGMQQDTVKATKTYGPTKSATMKEAAWVLPVAATDTAIAMFVLKVIFH